MPAVCQAGGWRHGSASPGCGVRCSKEMRATCRQVAEGRSQLPRDAERAFPTGHGQGGGRLSGQQRPNGPSPGARGASCPVLPCCSPQRAGIGSRRSRGNPPPGKNLSPNLSPQLKLHKEKDGGSNHLIA